MRHIKTGAVINKNIQSFYRSGKHTTEWFEKKLQVFTYAFILTHKHLWFSKIG